MRGSTCWRALCTSSSPSYVAERIRQDPPPDSHVVEGSTPVVAFGDVLHARVATLGLNPSRIEFEVRRVELDGSKRRFETTRSLGLVSLADATDTAVAAIFRRCNEYFQRNPYRRWFNRLEPVLRSVGASYYDGTACHLDLSQWATDPTWNGLLPAVRSKLVDRDGPFLARQLEAEQIEVLLLNGAAVVDGFRWVLGTTLDAEPETVSDRSGPETCHTLTLAVTGRARDAGVMPLGSSILTLLHEAYHLRGETDEGVTDCAALA